MATIVDTQVFICLSGNKIVYKVPEDTVSTFGNEMIIGSDSF